MTSRTPFNTASNPWISSNTHLGYTNVDPILERELKRQANLEPLERQKEVFSRMLPLTMGIPENMAENLAAIRRKNKVPFDALMVPNQCKVNMDFYFGDNEKERLILCKKENSPEIQELKKKETIKVLKQDAGKNAKVMLVSVFIFGGLGSLGWLASPLGGMIGTPVGVGAGLLVGGLVVKHLVNEQVNIAIQFSDHYVVWKNEAIASKIYPIFRNFLDADHVFQDFMCPIADDICSIPVKSKFDDKHTYNQKHIFDYIDDYADKKTGKVNDLFGGTPFGKEDLLVDSAYCHRLLAKMKSVSIHVLQLGREIEIQYGIDAVMTNTQDLMSSIRKSLGGPLWMDYEEKIRKGTYTNDEAVKYWEKSLAQWDFTQTDQSPIDVWDIVKDFLS